jgi:hypothetical protein
MPALEPFQPLSLLVIAAVNPAVIIVAVVMGRAADQWQKLIVAAFAAALAGFILVLLAARLGLIAVTASGGEAGLFLLQLILGLLWAGLGYAARRRRLW